MFAREGCDGLCPAEEGMCQLLATAYFNNIGSDVQVREFGRKFKNTNKLGKGRHKKKKLATSNDVTKEEGFHGFIHGDKSCPV